MPHANRKSLDKIFQGVTFCIFSELLRVNRLMVTREERNSKLLLLFLFFDTQTFFFICMGSKEPDNEGVSQVPVSGDNG